MLWIRWCGGSFSLIEQIPINDAKFVRTKDELCFQEVVDSFPDANRILVYSFNISLSVNRFLLEQLRKAGEHAEIIFVSNLPDRRKKYDKEKGQITQRRIDEYKNRLRPENFGEKANVFFDFNNHSKIIATNEVAYIGSANFSDASASNLESGIITRDSHFIQYLFESVQSTFTEETLPYYEILFPFAMQLMGDLRDKRELYCEFRDSCYSLSGHGYSNVWYYLNENVDLKRELLDTVYLHYVENEVLGSFVANLEDLELEQTSEFSAILNELNGFKNRINEILELSSIYDLFTFDLSSETNKIFYKEYSIEEEADKYLEKAQDEALEKVRELSESCRNYLDEMIVLIHDYNQKYKELINHSKGYKIVNRGIDNA